jgi:hypothetical protein
MGSHPGGSAESSVRDWAAVITMIVGAGAMGAAIILAVPWLGILGGVLLVGGGVYAFATGIMNRTEDYGSVQREDTT